MCVNGAGSYGCMSAMNDGVALADGHVIGVIHSMWLKPFDNIQQEAGAHQVFESSENAGGQSSTASKSATAIAKKFKRELIVASGDDLQERKRLLVENADALIVLPGGPGTWDELWEMACVKGIGLSSIPIVCVNCDNYYEPFQEMLKRAFEEGLMKRRPEDLVHFVGTAEEAVRWVEAIHLDEEIDPPKSSNCGAGFMKAASFFHDPLARRSPGYKRARPSASLFRRSDYAFACGVAIGAFVATSLFALCSKKS